METGNVIKATHPHMLIQPPRASAFPFPSQSAFCAVRVTRGGQEGSWTHGLPSLGAAQRRGVGHSRTLSPFRPGMALSPRDCNQYPLDKSLPVFIHRFPNMEPRQPRDAFDPEYHGPHLPVFSFPHDNVLKLEGEPLSLGELGAGPSAPQGWLLPSFDPSPPPRLLTISVAPDLTSNAPYSSPGCVSTNKT